MLIRKKKFKLEKPITLTDEVEITMMTGVPGMILCNGIEQVTIKPIEEEAK